MTGTYDELAAHADQHRADLLREAELRRIARRTRKSGGERTLASGRTLRIVLPAVRVWPRRPAADEPTAA